MKYNVHYWARNLIAQTGLTQGEAITEEQLMELIREKKVNVMVHHVTSGTNAGQSYCYIDDLQHRFQQR